MKIGYARVSTDGQDEALQVDALERAGCDRIFIDRGVSGAVPPSQRPQFSELALSLTDGDRVTVWKLDRLGRSLRSIIDTLDGFRDLGVEFCSIMESIDTTSAHGRAMWQMMGVFAELERETIRERTREGIEAARRRGRKFGRPKSLSQEQVHTAQRLIDRKEESVSSMARQFGVDRGTLRRALNN